MMTSEIINYYASLLILQYLGKPKAYANIQTVVTPVIMDQLPLAVQDAFAVPTAIGVQLDVLGKYAGVSRNQYDFSGPVTLDDDDYRKLIQIQIIQNSSGSSLATIQQLLQTFFPDVIQVYDYQDMTMDYFFLSTIGSQQLAEVFIEGGFLPRPMAVRLRGTIVHPTIDNFFGFRTYYGPGENVNPFNSYADYQMDWPWLSYQNALVR